MNINNKSYEIFIKFCYIFLIIIIIKLNYNKSTKNNFDNIHPEL